MYKKKSSRKPIRLYIPRYISEGLLIQDFKPEIISFTMFQEKLEQQQQQQQQQIDKG